MIRRVGDRLVVESAMTLETASALLVAGRAALVAQGETLFDLARVGEADSAALALLFAWQRTAGGMGGKVRVLNPPASFLSLAELYGVTDLLPL